MPKPEDDRDKAKYTAKEQEVAAAKAKVDAAMTPTARLEEAQKQVDDLNALYKRHADH